MLQWKSFDGRKGMAASTMVYVRVDGQILQHQGPTKKRESSVDGDPVQGLVDEKVEIHGRAMSETQHDGGSTVKDKAELERGAQFRPKPPLRFG